MTGFLATAGEVLAVTAAPRQVLRLIEEAAGEPMADAAPAAPTVVLDVQGDGGPFDRAGFRPLTRGAYARDGQVLLLDACSSGFDLRVTADRAGGVLAVQARYRPAPRTRAANRALPGRFRLLAGQTLVHYPVLWRSGWRGRVPLHAGVLAAAGAVPLLAGPGGVGKSTVLRRAVAAGAVATADNMCSADPVTCFGLAEPLRLDRRGSGRAAGTSHGRRGRAFGRRAPALSPDRVVVLERGPGTEVAAIGPDEAATALVAGTYAAGELRRYWAFAATLALGTGVGPAPPPGGALARGDPRRRPGGRVRAGDGDAVGLDRLCAAPARAAG